MSQLTVIATMRAKPGKEADLQEHLLRLVPQTRTEAGCIDYDLHRLQEDPSVFVMYENWVDRGELDKHLQMPYMRAFGAALPDLLRSPLELQMLDTLSTPRA
ncbi:putative quinol monooxygenase [Herbaspirillum sp. SJZ107]|uniref:putative quinol monooxygenase n=1 Tax=Herbaspirillum sp. SJZ107 TaxID=2572881 RepID=UPI001152A621|nr:putative quinol monooxygenase [Herbaspirillum sp. SJZ107]TQK11716.1 quinol monooxygenase YgiN [Herbaspirillum sp. SJZ107]